MDENKERPERRTEAVVTGEVTKCKKPLLKRLTEYFINPDIDDIPKWLFTSVVVPAVCDAIVEAVENLFDQGLGGGYSRRVRGRQMKERSSLDDDYTRYSRQQKPAPRDYGKSSEVDFVVMGRADAEAAADKLYYLLNKYDQVRVADYKDAVDLSPQYTDNNWGWTTLPDKLVRRAHGGGYYLDMPRPKQL